METWTCLQDVLQARAQSGSGLIHSYPLGDVENPASCSYRDLYFQAQHNSLKIRGIFSFKENHPILLHLDSHVDTMIWFWSVLFAGGRPVILGSYSPGLIDQLTQLLEQPICITNLGSSSIWDASQGFYLYQAERWQKVETTSIKPSCLKYHGGSETTCLMLTSGSSGTPKAVPLTHEQILAAVAGKSAVRPLPRNLPFLNWVGLDHVASLVEIHIQALWLGFDQVHVHAMDVVSSPTVFLSLLHRHKVSRTFAPNFFLAKLVSSVQHDDTSKKWDLSNLTLLTSGGEDNNVSTCIEASSILRKYNAPANVIATGFGMTETCAGAIFNLECPDYDISRGRSVASLGTCMDGIEMRITVPGEILRLAELDEPGDLELRGSVVFKGYYHNPHATKAFFTADGWFRTGDQATIDSRGHLNLVGRVKDTVNINGAKFPMAPIQKALDQTLSHKVGRVIAFPAKMTHTEQVVITYVPRVWEMDSEEVLEIEDLATQVCQLQCGASPLIFALGQEAISILPSSSLGKISRNKMKSLFESGAFSRCVDSHKVVLQKLREAIHDAGREDITDAQVVLIQLFAELQKIDASTISTETSIFDLGFTSIDVLRLKLRIERQMGITVPVTTILRHPNASALAKALEPASNNNVSSPAAKTPYEPVIVLNATGSKTPLWLVHPGIGEVLVFVGLARYVANDDRPVYALRARGFEPGHERFKTINEAVDAYVLAIRQRQAKGPYAIAGYSYGTMLAFEITKKLKATDGPGTVRFLGSLNLPPHIKMRMRQLNWNNCLLHLAQFLGLVSEEHAERIEGSEYHNMTQDNAMTYILDIANKERIHELGLDRLGLVRWTHVAYDLPRMAVDYEPQGNVPALDVFFATPLRSIAHSRQDWMRDHLSKWQDFCTTPPRFHEVGGAHYTMIGPDHVGAFSAVLLSALHARGI